MISVLLAVVLSFSAGGDYSERTLYGTASWYDATKNSAWYTRQNKHGEAYEFYAAAGPAMRKLAPFKWGDNPYRVRLTNLITGKSIIAWVVDVCRCNQGKKNKLIDLSPAAFVALGVSLTTGVQRVRADIFTPYADGAR